MATGYSRQSAASIVTGLVVEAAPINAELNALLGFANASTGHNHDGTAGGGAKIHLVNSVDTATKLRLQEGGTNADLSAATTGASIVMGSTGLSYIKNNYAGTADPAVTDDTGDGYSVGSQWVHVADGELFICTDATLGAAVWVELDAGSGLVGVIGTVKVTTADTTPSVLDSAIAVSGALTKTVTNPSANEVLTLGVAAATTSVVGAVELATDAEAAAQSSSVVVLTPSNLAACSDEIFVTGKQAATESVTGVVELATVDEAHTGSDTSRAITAAGLHKGLKYNITPLNTVGSLYTTVNSGTTAGAIFTRYKLTGTATLTLPSFGTDNEWTIVEFAATSGTTMTVGRNSQTIDGTAADDTCTTKGPIVLYYRTGSGAVESKLIGSVPD